ncbi:MAG: hypothetical protein ACXAC5_03380 [Promethearchaeota archaeon]|jgi:alpha-D-ribose 1-methylphosphonate 5-triphosphate synthase subunit PhnI
MIIDTTKTKVERQIAAVFKIIEGEEVLVPTFELYEHHNLETGHIVQRRFRDCQYCLTRVEHPTTCKYDDN